MTNDTYVAFAILFVLTIRDITSYTAYTTVYAHSFMYIHAFDTRGICLKKTEFHLVNFDFQKVLYFKRFKIIIYNTWN